jgi:hypothetical protein
MSSPSASGSQISCTASTLGARVEADWGRRPPFGDLAPQPSRFSSRRSVPYVSSCLGPLGGRRRSRADSGKRRGNRSLPSPTCGPPVPAAIAVGASAGK